MHSPTLDARDAQAFYEEALDLARLYCPSWAEYWPDPLGDAEVGQDVGLVLLKLFSQLAGYTADMENLLPQQRRLAFFQFLNLHLRPPLPATGPLQFKLKPQRPPRLVPAGTAVLMPPEQLIRFQTTAELLVLPATLTAAMTLIPDQDEYINALPTFGTQGTVPLFVARRVSTLHDDPAEKPLGHALLLGDPQLFKPDDSLQDIRIDLTGKQLYPEYFGQWADGALAPLAAELTPSPGGMNLSIVVKQPPAAGPRDIAALQNQLCQTDGLTRPAPDTAEDGTPQAQPPQYWLLARPRPQVKLLKSFEAQLPVVTGLQCTLRGKLVLPQQAAYNTQLLDLPNGAFPFGPTPQIDDAFYLRCDPVFAKTGALVRLELRLTDVATAYPVSLSWQFWDGSQWQTLNATPDAAGRYQFVDTTSNLQFNAVLGDTFIQFLCPGMKPAQVAGSQGWWLRAVIVSGGYGKAGGIQTQGVDNTIDAIPESILSAAQKSAVSKYLNDVAGVNFSYQVDPGAYAPPFIRSLQISYSYCAQPGSYWSYNAFTLSRFLRSPFKPVEQARTSFYFAFATDDFDTHTLGNKLTLYFDLVEDAPHPAQGLLWYWHDGAAWQALAVDDGTRGLARSGVVRFVVPAAMRAAELFSQRAFWFRIDNPQVDRTIRAHGVYPNVVEGRNATTVEDEALGASNEQPGQTFQLSAAPVLAGMELDVIEPASLGNDSEASAAALRPAGEDAVYRRWRQVETFAFSGPTDRVFTLDPQNGLITFGNGRNGMIPPAGHNNVIATRYDATQGLAGNVAANCLTLLSPGMADIDAVNNPAAARGGVGGDTVAELERKGPGSVRTAGRGVALSDLGVLAEAADQRVARARAIELLVPDCIGGVPQETATGPRISVAVLALASDPVPLTPPALLESVGRSLRARCLAPLAARIDLRAPEFVPIHISAQVAVTTPGDRQQATQDELAQALMAFLQPVFGGPAAQGWPFGARLRTSEITQFLRQQASVRGVLALSLNGVQGGQLQLAPAQLPIAGRIAVLAYSD